MPGVNRENLEIETEGETLFINAKRMVFIFALKRLNTIKKS